MISLNSFINGSPTIYSKKSYIYCKSPNHCLAFLYGSKIPHPPILLWFNRSKKKKPYGPFLWMGFNCLKATEPLQGDSLLFTNKFP